MLLNGHSTDRLVQLRWVLLAALVSSIVLAAFGPVAAASNPEPVLWLAAPTEFAPLPNFTATAPRGDAPALVAPAPIVAGSGQVAWKWTMPRLPAEYVGVADTRFELAVALEGLARVAPVHRDAAHATSIGKLVVRADVLRLSADAPIASGSTTLPTITPGEDPGVLVVNVTMIAPKSFSYGVTPGDAPLFGIKITLYAVATNTDAPHVLVGDPERPSRLLAPAFPMGALLDWANEDRLHAMCNERILQGRDCTGLFDEAETTDAQTLVVRDPVLVEEASTLGPLFAMAFGMMLLYLARVRIRQARA